MRVLRRAYWVAVLLVLGSVISATSAAAQGRVRGLLRLGGDYGGDPVLQFRYSDGSTPEVTSGGGILLLAGATVRAIESGVHGLDAQLSAGLKYRTIPPADNQDATWLRFPVEALLFYAAPRNVRVGGGAVVHFGNVLRTSGDAIEGRIEFQSTPGAIFQAEYHRGNVAFDARYTLLRYKVDDDVSESVNANSFGLGLSFLFGRQADKAAPRQPA